MIFLIDTVRSDRLNSYGYQKYVTSPAIDALAAEGVLFEQAYSPGPWTLPTVASLMTGLPLCEHQTLAPRETLPPELETLAQRLQRAGYTTLGLFANSMVSPRYGFERGYTRYLSSTRNDGPKVAAALNRDPELPFFLYVHNLEPHNPYHFAPPETPGYPSVGKPQRQQMMQAYKGYRKASRVDYQNNRPLGTEHQSDAMTAHMATLNGLRQEFSDLYDATVLLADAKLGSTIAMLKQRGVWDDTLAIFLSDHGEEFGEHGGWLHDQSVYEEMVRVPLIIKFPGGEYAGRRVARPVDLLDVMPTLADYMGYPGLARGARGESLLPLIRGESADADGWHVVAMRHNRERYYEPWKRTRGDVNIAARRGDWKAIWNVEVDTLELYDLKKDPGELSNLADQHADVAQAARTALAAWYEGCRAAQRAAQENPAEMDAETIRNLQQLGYLGGGDDDDDDDEEEDPDPSPKEAPESEAPATTPAGAP